MSKYIKVRELENLKCHLDECVEFNKGLGDKDIFYRGTLAAYKSISELLDEIMDEAVDIVEDIKKVRETFVDDFVENVHELKETKGIKSFVVGQQKEINRIIGYLGDLINEYE